MPRALVVSVAAGREGDLTLLHSYSSSSVPRKHSTQRKSCFLGITRPFSSPLVVPKLYRTSLPVTVICKRQSIPPQCSVMLPLGSKTYLAPDSSCVELRVELTCQ
jgi:hypothetical protein